MTHEYLLTVGVVVFFYFPESERQFPHPVHASPHAPGGEVDLGGRGVGAEAVGVEVVARQVLTVIVAGHVVNMNLEHNISAINFKTFLSNLIIQIRWISNYKLRYQSKRIMLYLVKTYKD